uniref:Uncharacterized protein n=1 Tax=Oryza punctata TaxID=4537 RepID=A0A0E0K2A1_ORYPU
MGEEKITSIAAHLTNRLLIRRLPRTEAAGRAAKGVVLRTTLRPPPPLDAVITRVVQLRVAEDQESGTPSHISTQACHSARTLGQSP